MPEESVNLHLLPTEILLYIFTNLRAKDLIKHRQVCQRWRNIIDSLYRSEKLWQEYCKNDFTSVYKIAKAKARAGMLWFNIYKSLSLWPCLSVANETIDEFASASDYAEENIDFRILKNGTIGVHKKGAIAYYNIETLSPTLYRRPIFGNYLRYNENDKTMVILGFQFELFVLRTSNYNSRFQPNAVYDNVKSFLLVNQIVYFVTSTGEIYSVNLDEENLTATLLCRSAENVLCLGYSNGQLNILTYQRNILTLNKNKQLIFAHSLGPDSKLLTLLKEYNFLEDMDWRVFFNWMYIFNHTIPNGPMRDIIIIRTYGDIVLVGCNWGVLRIYHSPYINGELDLFNVEPVKQYNFMERSDCPVLSDFCPVIQIDVMESQDGHIVIAAMPKKLVVINFTHYFKITSSVALIPYVMGKEIIQV